MSKKCDHTEEYIDICDYCPKCGKELNSKKGETLDEIFKRNYDSIFSNSDIEDMELEMSLLEWIRWNIFHYKMVLF